MFDADDELFLYEMVEQQKALSPTSSRNYCQRLSPPLTSNRAQTGLEPAQNLSSGLVEWIYAVEITINHYSKCKSNY